MTEPTTIKRCYWRGAHPVKAMLTVDDGTRIELGRQLGSRGGEGCVYEVIGNPSVVAKKYHIPPDTLRLEKLRAQDRLTDVGLRRIAAWPQALLTDNGRCVGFIMPRVEGQPIHLLYRPIDRRQYFPDATWQNLVTVAQNVAAAFHTLHTKGILMADVNESNLLITKKGEARMIDCDSYQICTSGRTYPCEVGVALWTPPELQGKMFGNMVREEQHDAFGLAVLIFHVLFMGKHPFAGVPNSPQLMENPPPIEQCIKEFQFAHSRRGKVQFKSPPFSLPLSSIPEGLSDLFERAFLSSNRPSADVWYKELGALEFQRCQWGHIFYRRINDCPWCAIWNAGGPNFFISTPIADTTLTSGAEMERFVSEILRMSTLGLDDVSSELSALAPTTYAVPLIQSLRAPTPKATPFPPNVTRYRPGYFVGWAVIILEVFFLFVDAAAWPIWFLLGLGGLISVCGGIKNPAFGREIEHRKNKVEEVRLAIEKHLASMANIIGDATRNFERERNRLVGDIRRKQNDAEMEFLTKRVALVHRAQELLRKYKDLPNVRQAMRRDRLERTQKEEFLRQFRISAHRIPQIGPARSATLAQYGVITAYDVKSIGYLPRLGQGDSELRKWLARLEGRFRFNPSLDLSYSAKQDVDRDLQKLEEAMLDDFRNVRNEWHALKMSADPSRIRQLRARKVSEYKQVLDQLSQSTFGTYRRNESGLSGLLKDYGQAKVDADTVPKV